MAAKSYFRRLLGQLWMELRNVTKAEGAVAAALVIAALPINMFTGLAFRKKT